MPVTVKLEKVGDTVVVAIPQSLLDALGMSAGGSVALVMEGDRLVVERTPSSRPRYTLDELLAGCEAQVRSTDEDREWLGNPAAGAELI